MSWRQKDAFIVPTSNTIQKESKAPLFFCHIDLSRMEIEKQKLGKAVPRWTPTINSSITCIYHCTLKYSIISDYQHYPTSQFSFQPHQSIKPEKNKVVKEENKLAVSMSLITPLSSVLMPAPDGPTPNTPGVDV